MKRFLTSVCAALAAVLLAITLAGCSNSVAGKTYAFNSVTVEYSQSADQTDRTILDVTKSAWSSSLSSTAIAFNKNGTAVIGKITVDYSQDGEVITFGNDNTVSLLQYVGVTFTVQGKTLSGSKDVGTGVITITFQRV